MAVTETIATTDLEFARQLGQQLRVDSIRCSTAAGSGHPTSSMSAADLIAVLLTRYLQYDWSKPKDPNNDHLIYSKGHASPLCYAMFKAAGAITDAELMTFRKFGSRLQGHPTPAIPWVDVATGSLGQGLPIGVGVALAGQYLDKLPFHVWVLCGDSELAEGSIWEAIDKAGHYKLANLTAIWDLSRLAQRGETEFGWNLDTYRRRVEAFGCFPIVIDGHDIPSIDRAFGEALSNTDKPSVIIAKTIKGKGFSEIENKDGWHGKTLPADMAERAIKELGGIRNLKVKTQKPDRGVAPKRITTNEPVLPIYKMEDKVATRKAYGDALLALAALEDRAMMRAIHGSTVLYPCDPNQTARLTRAMADTPGIVFMRTTRGAYPTLYGPDETFKVGGSKVVRQSPRDKVALIGAGVTLHNCLAAADALAAKKIPARVIDLYSVKPVDVKTLREAARVTKGRLVVVEDHYPQGGIGAAVLEALAADPPPRVVHLAVRELPESGKPEELMNAAGISSKSIVAAATKLAQAK